jgi:intracellular multiplication protein IcmB
MGAGRARQLLAINFPGGSARSEIKRRVIAKSEEGLDSKSAMTSAVINELVEEIVESARKSDEEDLLQESVAS